MIYGEPISILMYFFTTLTSYKIILDWFSDGDSLSLDSFNANNIYFICSHLTQKWQKSTINPCTFRIYLHIHTYYVSMVRHAREHDISFVSHNATKPIIPFSLKNLQSIF